MSTYQQLTQAQRYQIYALLKTGQTQTEIADMIGVHKSTISRELSRNRSQRGYRPKQAHQKALSRRQKAVARIRPETWAVVDEKLRQDWSPEQISGWLKRWRGVAVSHEWIYQYVLADQRTGGDLHRHLRCQQKRRKRYGKYDRRGQLPNRVSIEQRPAIVDRRERLGDWEADTLLGQGRRQAIVTLTERKSRLALLYKVERRKADQVGDAIVALLHPVVEDVHTVTLDNGKEFAEHQRLAQDLHADFYFAHPYAAWERGTNENMNGLVRQYIPKNCDLSTVTKEELSMIMKRLNHRPRKCLGFQSPFEVFFQHSVALTS